MSFLRRGERRRGKVAAALTTVGAVAAFQALAIVGAGFAYASTCTYDPSTDRIEITIDAGEFVGIAVETTADDLDTESVAGDILVDLDGLGFENGAASTQCGDATNSNTVAIVVLGQPGDDESFEINEVDGGTFNTAIAWNVSLGGNPVGTTDQLGILLNGDQDNNLVLTNTSFNLNGGVGEVLGVERYDIDGDDGDDTVDASAVTFVVSRLHGHSGDDVLMPGTADDDDTSGGSGIDTLSYATRTTPLFVENGVEAGLDANADGDNDDAGEETDDIDCFEIVVTGSANDTIDDGLCGNSAYAPGDGDDDVTGDASDTVDWSTSSAGMTIDTALGTATGQGADTFDGPENFVGSAFDDTLIWDAGTVNTFVGGEGTDTVDASAETAGQSIDLDFLDDGIAPLGPFTADSLENAIGGSGDDNLDGNDLRNVLTGNDGDDDLDGDEGNDTFFGGLGNDDFTGDEGADTVSFANSPAGIDADLLSGFATGEGDDSFGDTIEIVIGSAFNDTITGGGGTVATNFRFVGGAGQDTLTGSGSNDNLKGGGGKDILRGAGGDDTLLGNAGNDKLFGGNGTDVGKGGKGKDVCSQVEIRNSCGTKKNPKAPQSGVAGRLD